MSTELLSTWRDGPTKAAIVAFVEQVSGPGGVPVEERIAVFDNDGTLWCEKPMPIQLDFILRRLIAMATEQPELQERQPWKAAFERDFAWFAKVMDDHYAGDDTQLPALAAGILAAHGGISVEEFETQAAGFLREAQHPTLGRGYLQTAYVPMIELLRYLEANGFTNYIVSGGGRDFMRPISDEVYGIGRERVVGSASTLAYTSDGPGGTIIRQMAADYLDDGPVKPVRIWSRAGRRPLLAGGNSNGDLQMLEFAHHASQPTLRVLIRHDDAEREFVYDGGAEQVLERAATDGWTVVSMKDDWTTVFER